MKRIRKGDQVVVIAGKDKGTQGEVLSVAGDRVVVSNVAIMKRHTKPNPQLGVAGGIVEREASIHISNVMLYNAASGKGERVSIKVEANGPDGKIVRTRVFRSGAAV